MKEELERLQLLNKAQADRIEQLDKRSATLVHENIHLGLIVASMTKQQDIRRLPLDAQIH